jgi:hypothetical protein
MPEQPNLWEELGLPRLELDILSSPVRRTLENYSTLMERRRRADIRREAHIPDLPGSRPLPFSEFGFVNSWRANAYVDGLKNESLVTFTAALPFAIRDCFDYLLFDDRILRGHSVPDPRLGRSKDIDKPPETYDFLRGAEETGKVSPDTGVRWVSYTYQDYRQSSQRVGIGRFSKHPPMNFEGNVVNREMLADELSSIAANFLLFHEIAHVTQGHLKYRIAELKTTRFAEMSSEQVVADDPKTLQALEVDADLGAALQVFATLKPADDPLAKYVQARTPIDFQVQRYLFSLGVLLMLLQRKTPAPESYGLSSHPPHILRFGLVCRAALTLEASFSEKDRPLFKKGFAQALLDLSLSAELFDASSIVPRTDDSAVRAHETTLLNRLEEIRPALRTYAPDIEQIGDALLCRRESLKIDDPKLPR